jgi:hypothetical protein
MSASVNVGNFKFGVASTDRFRVQPSAAAHGLPFLREVLICEATRATRIAQLKSQGGEG